jgi:hypothetical protein
MLSNSAAAVRGISERSYQTRHPDGPRASQGDDGEMFTIEEDSGTYTGSIHPHNGYYAGDFTRIPTRMASQIAALANLRHPTVPIMSGTAH